MEGTLQDDRAILSCAEAYSNSSNFMFIGRGFGYPSALEGALKLKEISYIHAEAYPAGELKHGPIALIDERMPVVAIVTQSRVYDKMASNIEEANSRGARVIAVATKGDTQVQEKAEQVI